MDNFEQDLLTPKERRILRQARWVFRNRGSCFLLMVLLMLAIFAVVGFMADKPEDYRTWFNVVAMVMILLLPAIQVRRELVLDGVITRLENSLSGTLADSPGREPGVNAKFGFSKTEKLRLKRIRRDKDLEPIVKVLWIIVILLWLFMFISDCAFHYQNPLLISNSCIVILWCLTFYTWERDLILFDAISRLSETLRQRGVEVEAY